MIFVEVGLHALLIVWYAVLTKKAISIIKTDLIKQYISKQNALAYVAKY